MDVQLALFATGWLLGWWLLWSVPLVRPGRRTEPVTRSYIVPARNEADSLPNLLDGLMAMRHDGDEVIVVDDRSTDATPDIAARYGATVIDAGDLPEGWTGKSWACHRGVEHSTGSVLVFLDADVRVGPGGLDAIAALHAERAGLVSVQPYHETERAYERLSALFNVVAFMGVGAASPPHGRSHGAFGPCLVTTRADYERVGGHAAVRGDVVEDLALARRFEEAGLPVSVRGGGELVRFRMYPGGVRQLLDGWTKNMATGAGMVPLLRTLATVVWITAMLTTVQWAIETVAGAGPGPLVLVVGFGAFVVQLRIFFERLGDFEFTWALLYPVLLGVFLVVFARSLWATVVRRSVPWRGRAIPVGRQRRIRTAPDTAGGP